MIPVFYRPDEQTLQLAEHELAIYLKVLGQENGVAIQSRVLARF